MLTPQTLAVNSLKRVGWTPKVLATSPYAGFQRTYWTDPAAFVHDCFNWKPGEEPADYQDEILTALVTHHRASARGPHGLGKSALASWAVLWFSLTRDGQADWKAPVTASVWRQLTKFFFPELRKWSSRLRWDKVGRDPFNRVYELQALSLKLSTGEAFAVASDEPSAIEGAHATELLYVFDEAKAINVGTWDAAEGAFSNAGTDTTANAYALAISTPGETSGRFYDIHARKPGTLDWWAKHVTLAEAIAAKRISQEWADARRQQWGETSAVYQNRVEGNFADSGEDSVIPLKWIEAANERYRACGGKGEGAKAYGVDVARYGPDKTTIAPLVGRVLQPLSYYAKQGTMETAGRVAAAVDMETPVGVDVIGVGAGVYDRLEELGYKVLPVNVSESTDMKDASGQLGFVNLRSAIWWLMRDALDPDGDNPVALPPDDQLTGDLTAPTWTYTSRGQIKIESKDDIRGRIGRSTDAADAFGLALYAAVAKRRRHRADTW